MSHESAEVTSRTFKYCTVQLSLFSLMMLTSLSGFCGGLVWAAILVFARSIGLAELENFDGVIEIFIGFPIVGGLGAGLFALVGYPIYNWVCNNIRGQRLRGTFFEPHN